MRISDAYDTEVAASSIRLNEAAEDELTSITLPSQ
jgi:hypothetical protein